MRVPKRTWIVTKRTRSNVIHIDTSRNRIRQLHTPHVTKTATCRYAQSRTALTSITERTKERSVASTNAGVIRHCASPLLPQGLAALSLQKHASPSPFSSFAVQSRAIHVRETEKTKRTAVTSKIMLPPSFSFSSFIRANSHESHRHAHRTQQNSRQSHLRQHAQSRTHARTQNDPHISLAPTYSSSHSVIHPVTDRHVILMIYIYRRRVGFTDTQTSMLSGRSRKRNVRSKS